MNPKTLLKLDFMREHPSMSNIELGSHFGCHPNNFTNLRARYSSYLNNTSCTEVSKKNVLKTDINKQTTTNKQTKRFLPLEIALIKPLTKHRFIAELLGYTGKSLTVQQYKNYIIEVLKNDNHA